MPNVHLTPQMQDFAEREIATGAFANLSEVVRAGMRKLMEERGAAAFYALKADLVEQVRRDRGGAGEPFDPRASSRAPSRERGGAGGASHRRGGGGSRGIRAYTEESWGERSG